MNITVSTITADQCLRIGTRFPPSTPRRSGPEEKTRDGMNASHYQR